MTIESTVPVTAATEAVTPAPAEVSAERNDSSALSIAQASRLYAEGPRKKPDQAAPATAAAETGATTPAAKTESDAPKAEDAAPATPATGETKNDVSTTPAETPPRQLPRSWTKEQTDNWNKLTPEVQEFLISQDKTSSDAVRKAQNDAAAAAKAAQAKETAAETARNEYEKSAREAKALLLRHQQSAFADVQNMDDVVKLQQSDPVRFQEWQVHQMQLNAANDAVKAADERKASESKTKRAEYANSQMAALREAVPELQDDAKFNDTLKRALPLLADNYGISTDHLNKWIESDVGHEILNSTGFHRLVVDALFNQDANAAHKAAMSARDKEIADLKTKLVPPTVPPVVRPGAAPARGDVASATVQQLSKTLTNSGSLNDAVKFLVAKKAARR